MKKILFKYKAALLFFCFLIAPCLLQAQVIWEADGPGDTYELIRSKGLKAEVPDCAHPVKHIAEVWDEELKKFVFVFDNHVDVDNDRCRNLDRHRNEVTVTDSLPPSYLGAKDGDTFTYTWKFKLDKDFQSSRNFCHIHQIKAVGGKDDGAPLITLSTRHGNPDKFELNYSPSSGGRGGRLIEIDLQPLKGIWIEALETITYGEPGKFSIILKRVSDGKELASYESEELDLTREGAFFYRPKIGVYRSHLSKSLLRDESVWFADFGIAKGNSPALKDEHNIAPAAPSNLTATDVAGNKISVQWSDNAFNENLFRLERSTDGGANWIVLASVTPAWERFEEKETYTNMWLRPGTTYLYRVRAENLYGVSDYSNTISVTTKPTSTN